MVAKLAFTIAADKQGIRLKDAVNDRIGRSDSRMIEVFLERSLVDPHAKNLSNLKDIEKRLGQLRSIPNITEVFGAITANTGLFARGSVRVVDSGSRQIIWRFLRITLLQFGHRRPLPRARPYPIPSSSW